MTLEGATAVTPEQVAAWLRISDRKMTARRVLKSTNPTMKFDHRVCFTSVFGKTSALLSVMLLSSILEFGIKYPNFCEWDIACLNLGIDCRYWGFG